jgi:hypothetical protein
MTNGAIAIDHEWREVVTLESVEWAIMRRLLPRLAAIAVVAGVVCAPLAARQAAAPPPPIVKENATVRVGPHTFVIPDNNVGLVPNVGIIVGSTGTLVIDPGLGRRNGEAVLREVAKVSKNATLYIATTHFHAEHTTGYIAFPPEAR